MNNKINSILFALLAVSGLSAQTIDGIYEEPQSTYSINDRNNNPTDEDWNGVWRLDNRYKPPVAYSYLREADIMWSRMVWRKLDMREKTDLLSASGNQRTY
jgi:hypothetical protein